MKKSIKHLMFTGAVMITAAGAFAQKNLDLAITVTSPTATTFNHGDARVVKFNIMNNGPAAITPTDTIYYRVLYSGANTTAVSFLQGFNIASGATQAIDLGNVGTWQNTTNADRPDTFCVRIIPQTSVNSNGRAVTVTYKDTVTSNNAFCYLLTVKKQGAVGIFELNDNATKETLIIYPNPAANEVKFDVMLEKPEAVTAIVRDITGRKVMERDFGKIQSGALLPLQLNIAPLNAGMYIVEVMTGDKKAVGRVMKQD